MKIKIMKKWQEFKEKFDKYETGLPRFKFEKSIAILYNDNSRLDEMSSRMLGMQVESFRNQFFLERASQPFKIYPSTKVIKFEEKNLLNNEFFQILKKRKSVRKYKKYFISLKELYYILHYSYGINRKLPIFGSPRGKWYYKMVPSAGALYPLEIYVVTLKSEIESGIYHYRVCENCLELIKKGCFVKELNKIIFAEPDVELSNCSYVIIITAIFERVLLKYGDRGYRFILMEVGFVSQNISLICEVLGLGSCMIGGYLDDEVNKFLGIDGLIESVLNVIIIGKPNDRS